MPKPLTDFFNLETVIDASFFKEVFGLINDYAASQDENEKSLALLMLQHTALTAGWVEQDVLNAIFDGSVELLRKFQETNRPVAIAGGMIAQLCKKRGATGTQPSA